MSVVTEATYTAGLGCTPGAATGSPRLFLQQHGRTTLIPISR
jgi:hypothetical protein